MRAGSSIHQGTEDESMLLIDDGPPDVVAIPQAIGGGSARVIEAVPGPCPRCEHGAPHVRHLVLAQTRFRVAECAEHGFLWYLLGGKGEN